MCKMIRAAPGHSEGSPHMQLLALMPLHVTAPALRQVLQSAEGDTMSKQQKQLTFAERSLCTRTPWAHRPLP